MGRIKIKRVGPWWRVYLCTSVRRGMGDLYLSWTDIGAGDTWDEAIEIAREHYAART